MTVEARNKHVIELLQTHSVPTIIKIYPSLDQREILKIVDRDIDKFRSKKRAKKDRKVVYNIEDSLTPSGTILDEYFLK